MLGVTCVVGCMMEPMDDVVASLLMFNLYRLFDL